MHPPAQLSATLGSAPKTLSSNGNETDGLPWVVLKFGGTSIGKFVEKITNTIIYNALSTNRVAVVCSARSTDVKSKGTTSRLLKTTEEVLTGDKLHQHTVSEILNDHLLAAQEHIHSKELLERIQAELREDCAQLLNFLDALSVIKEVSPRSKDVIIGTGEKLSCRLVAGILCDMGFDAGLVNLENCVGSPYTNRDLNMSPVRLEQDFYDHLALQFSKEVHRCNYSIPVITGYFGPVPGSLLTSIGRGYTDLAAALVAVGLGGAELQIWKEVDGIFTADPRKVPQARLLPSISPEEAAELTYYGSEVIHPFTMEQVMRAKIPIRIKNVQNPMGSGSIILPEDGCDSDLNPSPVPSNKRRPTAVTIKEDMVILNVHSNRKSVSHDFLASLFSVLDRYNIVVDLIATSEVHVSTAISNLPTLLPQVQRDLQHLGQVELIPNMSILSLVGKEMRNMVGIASLMFNTLADANINIEMISQGSSEINISCLIDEKNSLQALRCIHKTLLEG